MIARFRTFINAWTHGSDQKTWVAHSVIAVALTPIIGPVLAVGYYVLRECEQVFYNFVDHKEFHPVDHAMDVLCPAIAVLGAVQIWGWIF